MIIHTCECGEAIPVSRGGPRSLCDGCLACLPDRRCARCDDGFRPRGKSGRSYSYCLKCIKGHRTTGGALKGRLCRCGRPVAEGRSRYCSDCGSSRSPTSAVCGVCGASFVRTQNRKLYCSDEHARLALRDRNRKKNYKRRIQARSGLYTLAEVAERDGWRCHVCGGKVNPALPGTHKRGATIDHLVPISRGGADTSENVALAHRLCNIKRGTGGEVQLRLV